MYTTIQLDMENIHDDVCAQIIAEADVRESDVEQYIRDHISEEFPHGDMLRSVAIEARSQVQAVVREELQNCNDIIEKQNEEIKELKTDYLNMVMDNDKLKADIESLNERLEIQGETILILQEMALKQSKRRRWFG